jgi:hypothetical protein
MFVVTAVVVTLIVGVTGSALNGGPASFVNVPLTWPRAFTAGAITGGITAYFYLLSLLKDKAVGR